MKSLYKLSYKFKTILAQHVFAQSGDIQTALENAELWEELKTKAAQFINDIKIPNDTSIHIQFTVSEGLKIAFIVDITPDMPTQSAALKALLEKNILPLIFNALKKAGINVEQPVQIDWVKF